MKKSVNNIVLSTLTAAFLVGCGSSSTTSSSTSASGASQKGPFKAEQTVTAQKLLANGSVDSSVAVVTTQTDNLGKFQFSAIPWSGATEFKVEGEYLDESTGQYVPGGLLTAVTNVVEGTAPKVNINILTHIAAENIKTQMADNISIDAAKEKAKEVISKVFKINLENTELESLDLTNENKDSATQEEAVANTKLLKLSAALSETTNPEETLKKLASDLSDDNGDGKVDGEAEAIFEELKQKESLVKLEEVAQKMEAVINVNTIPDSEDNLAGTMSINNGINFNDIYEAAQGESVSQTVTVGGIITSETVTSAEISVSNNATYLVNGLTPSSATISNGDELTIETTASNDYDGEEEIVVTIGGVDFDFKVQTISEPTLDDTKIKPIFLDFKKDITPSSSVMSEMAQIEGITSSTSVAIDIGTLEVSSDGITWNVSSGTVSNGDYIRVSHTASDDYSDITTSTITFGEGDNIVKVVFKSFTKVEDETPDDASFSDVVDAPIFDEENSTTEYITSEAISISGLDDKVDLEVINGEYSFDNISWSDEEIDNQIKNGDMIYLRHKAPNTNSTKTTTRLIVGKKLFEFNSFTIASAQEVDSTPNDFVFTSKFNQQTDSLVESNTITVSGVSEDTQIEISVSEDSEYSVNGTWSSENGTVKKGDIVSVRHTTSEDNLEKTETTLTIGGVSSKFVTFNKAADDVIPSEIIFERLDSQNINVEITSSMQYIRGINAETTISIENGMFSINGGDFVSSATVNDGDSIVVKHTTSNQAQTETKSIIKDENNKAFAYFVSKTKVSAPVDNSESPVTSVNNGDTYTYTPNVTGAKEFEIKNKPSWAVFNSKTGQLSGTPNNKNLEGVFEDIIITAKNDGGEVSLASFDITVKNIAPTINIVENYTINTNIFASEVLMDFPILDSVGETLTYEFISGTTSIPSFLEINSNTGEVETTGTPIEGTYNFKIKVTDSSNASSEKTINLVVSAESSTPTAPTISGTPVTNINEDENYLFTPSASDINGDTLSFSIENKPSWANFDTQNGSLSGIPSNDDVGTYSNIIISVGDGTHTTSLDSFNIEVKNTNDAPTGTTIPDQSISLSDTSSFSLDVTTFFNDVDANDTLTYDVTFASGELLPSWLSFTSNVLSVNGSLDSNYTGDYQMKVTATDIEGEKAVLNFTLTVQKDKFNQALDILDSIDPELEDIDTKLDEAKAILDTLTSSEAKVVGILISIAEIANNEAISNLIFISKETEAYTGSNLNALVRNSVMDFVNIDDLIKNEATLDLSSTATNTMHDIATNLKSLSDELGNYYVSSSDEYTYDNETMTYDDANALRATALVLAFKLENLAAYQWGVDSDFAVQDLEGNEFIKIDVDPASVLNDGNFFKLVAGSRIETAKTYLVEALDMASKLPVDYDDGSVTQDDLDTIDDLKAAFAGNGQYTITDFDETDEVKSVTIDLNKMFSSNTALSISDLGSSWINTCSSDDGTLYAGVDNSVAISYGYAFCEYSTNYGMWTEDAELDVDVLPTSTTSKIDSIVLNITLNNGEVFTGQGIYDYIFDEEDSTSGDGSISEGDSVPTATISSGDVALFSSSDLDWIDIAQFNASTLDIEMYEDNELGFELGEKESMDISYSSNNQGINLIEEGSTVITCTNSDTKKINSVNGISYSDLYRSSNTCVNQVTIEESDTWDWDWNESNTYTNDVNGLISRFTTGAYFEHAGKYFMLDSNNYVYVAQEDGYWDNGDKKITATSEIAGEWSSDANSINISMNTQYKFNTEISLDANNQIVFSYQNLAGYSEGDYMWTGSSVLNFFEDVTGIEVLSE